MSNRTNQNNQFEFSSQNTESTAVDSKATSLSRFGVAVALFKSFFNMPGLDLKIVEQLSKLDELGLRAGIFAVYSVDGVLTYDRPVTGDYTRYLMSMDTPEYLTVSVYTDGRPVSFKLKARGELECEPADQAQMLGRFTSSFSKGDNMDAENKAHTRSTASALRESVQSVNTTSKQFEAVLSKVQDSGVIDSAVQALESTKSMSDRMSALLPTIQGQVRNVMTVLGISCGVLLATVTVSVLFFIIRKVLVKMDKQKALALIAAAAGVFVLAGLACHEFSTAGAMLGKYAAWLKEKWTDAVHDMGSIAWNMKAPEGEELMKRMSTDSYIPARHSQLIFELSELICANVGWEDGLRFLIENIHFMPLKEQQQGMDAQSYVLYKAIHERSFSTITTHVIESMGTIHGLTDKSLVQHIHRISSWDHQVLLEYTGTKSDSESVETLSAAIVTRVTAISTAVGELYAIQEELKSLQTLPEEDRNLILAEEGSDAAVRRAKKAFILKNKAEIEAAKERKVEAKKALDLWGVTNLKSRRLIKKALSALTGDSWSRTETFDYTTPSVLPKEIAKSPAVTAETLEDGKVERPDDQQQAHKDDGLYSLFALGLALVRRFQNPKADTWELFKKLRTDSGNIKVGMSGANFLLKLVPDSLRVAAFASVGLGDPDDITKEERDIIARAFHLHKFMTDQKAHTTANKLVWKTAFDNLAHLMGPQFLSEKSSYTLGLCQKAYKLMCDQLSIINSIPDTAGHRPCTVGVWLHGVPGTGKSTLCTHLAQSLFASHPPNLRRHTWALDQKYITGFKSNHASIEVDDLGTNIPALQNCDFWGQLLTMLSTKPLTVNQADLQSKGMSFNAFAMFLQSNMSADKVLKACTDGRFLTNPDAVKRRFRGKNGVLAEVILEEAFKDANGNADEAKIAIAARENPAKTPWVKYKVNGELLDYDGLVARIVGCMSAALYEYKENCEAVKPGCHVNEYLLQTLATAREEAGIDATYGLFPDAKAAVDKLDRDLVAPALAEHRRDISQMMKPSEKRDLRPGAQVFRNFVPKDEPQMFNRKTRASVQKSKAKPFFASALNDVPRQKTGAAELQAGKLDTRQKWMSKAGGLPCGFWEEVTFNKDGKKSKGHQWCSKPPFKKTASFDKHSVPFGRGEASVQQALADFCEKLCETRRNDDGSIETEYIVHERQYLKDTKSTTSVSRVPEPTQRCVITWHDKGTTTEATITGMPSHPSGHCALYGAGIRDALVNYVTSLGFCDLPADVLHLPTEQRKMYLELLSCSSKAADSYLRSVLNIQEDVKGFSVEQMREWDDFAGGKALAPLVQKAKDDGLTVQQFKDSFKEAAHAEQNAKFKEKLRELDAKDQNGRSFFPDLASYPGRAVRSMTTIIEREWEHVKACYDELVQKLAKINWVVVAKALAVLAGTTAVAYAGYQLFKQYTEGKEEVKVQMPKLGDGLWIPGQVMGKGESKDTSSVGESVGTLTRQLLPLPTDRPDSYDDRQDRRAVNTHKGVLPASSRRPRHFVSPRDHQHMSQKEEPYLELVKRNTCSFSPHPLYNEHHHGAALFLFGRRLLMNAHYIGTSASVNDFPKDVTVRQQGQDFHAQMRWEDLDFFTNDSGLKTDFMVWRMPVGAVTIPDHPKVYQHFPRKRDLRDVYLRTPFTKNQAPFFLRAHTGTVHRHELDLVRITPDEQIYNNNLDGEDYKMPLAATYSSKLHSEGWCGSLIATPTHILGIHAIGRNMGDVSGYSTGIAQVFTYEMFESYVRDKPQMMVELDECSFEQAPINSNFGDDADRRGLKPGQAFFEFSLPAVPAVATKTSYVPTGLAENGSVLAELNEKVPSILHFRDPRYTGFAQSGPEFQASLLMRYENPPKGALGHRPLLHPRVLESITSKLADIPPRIDTRVWTLDEVLNPRRMGSVLNPVPRSTSSGLLHKGPGKKHYIGYDEGKDLYFAQGGLEGKVAGFLETVNEGKLPLTIYAEFCKDELRTAKKIAASSARTISGSPLTLTMVTTMCYGAFLDAFQRIPHKWGHTVGVDIMGRQWDVIITKLKENSANGFDGDFKAFDTTMSYQFMFSFFEQVDKWYKLHGVWSEGDRALRWACMYSLCFSKHACGKTVFTMFSGMCSGSRLTTIMNCFWSKTLLMYAYATLAPDDHLLGTCNLTIDGFDRFITCYVLGDDNFGSVKPEIESWFNPASISSALQKIGITYTPAKKNTDHSKTLRRVEDLEFLANTTGTGEGFNFIPFMEYYPVIKTSSLAKMVSYIKPSSLPGRDPCTATADNITAALLAAHLSGEERFDMVRQSVKVFRQLYPHSDYKFPTFQELCLKYLPLQRPVIVDQYQGITMSKTTTNVTNVQSSGVELNQDNSLETDTVVDARAGLDAPNVPVCQIAALQQGAPFPASAETVTFAPVMGITPECEKPAVETINTGNDMDLQSLMRMTWRDSFEWKSEAAEGEVLWQTRICPNGQLLDEGFGLNEIMQPTALASISSMYRYWHGGIKMSFSAVMSGVHVGRLGICVIYGSDVFPTSFSELTEQRYAVAAFDGMNKDVTVVLPYVATRRLKQTLTGSGQAEIDKCCTGTVTIFVMNQLRAPQSAAAGIVVNVLEGAGEDFKLYVPGANASTTYLFDALETADLKEAKRVKVKEYKNRRRDQYQMMSTQTPQATTSETGANEPVVMSSVSDSGLLPVNPIIKTPQTLLLLLRRQYVFGNNVNGVTSTLRSCNVTTPFAVGGLAMANLQPWNRLTDMHKVGKFFRVWVGTGQWSVYDQSGTNGITLSFHPTVNGQVANAGPFNSGTAQYGQTAFSGAWMYAPPRMGFANAVTPFTTTNHALKLPHFEKELGDDANTGAMQFQISDATARTAYTFAAGDGLHFAVRFAVPLMRCGNTAVQPDTWASTPVNVMRKVRDQYQMDTGSIAVTGSDKVGVALLEQDNQDVEEVHSVVPNTSDTKIIGQPQLDFCHFLERDQWIANFEWKTNDPIGEVLYDRPVPFGMFKNTAQRAIEAFRYFKMDAVVTVKIQATQFHQGRLCLMSMPMTDDQSAKSVLFAEDAKYAVEVPVEKRRVNWTFGNHAFVDAAASSTVTFTIPFRYIRPYLKKNESFAQFYIAVFNELRVGVGGSDAASCTVFVHFERCDLRVINPL